MGSTGSSRPCLWSRWWRCPDSQEIAYDGQGQDRDNPTTDKAPTSRCSFSGKRTAESGRRRAVMDDQVIRRVGRGRRTSHKSQSVNPRQADPRRSLVVRLEMIGATGSARDVDLAQDRRPGRAAGMGWEVLRVQWTVENCSGGTPRPASRPRSAGPDRGRRRAVRDDQVIRRGGSLVDEAVFSPTLSRIAGTRASRLDGRGAGWPC